MSRTTQRVRSSFYRSGGALRLGSVVAMLIIIGMLISRASDPNSWVWLTGKPADHGPAGTAHADYVTADDISPGPTDTDAEDRDAAREQFQAITDRTLELSREEMPAYWRLFTWASHQSLAELEKRASKTAVLNQFIQTPDEQRGKLFELDLNVRRVLSYDAPANSAGINEVYEIWGWTTESKAWLYVVLTADLPAGMPIGPDVNERVKFAGYFLKVQGYHAAGAGPRDKPLAAPLLIGRVAWKKTTPPAAATVDESWLQGPWIFPLLLGALGLGVWAFIPRRNAARRTVADECRTSGGSEVRNWLANAEHGATNEETRPGSRFYEN